MAVGNMYNYLLNHNYISKNENKDPFRQQELSKERADAISNFYENSISDFVNIIEEKDREIAKLKEDIEDLNNDIAENYRPIPRAEQYDMGECNFH